MNIIEAIKLPTVKQKEDLEIISIGVNRLTLYVGYMELIRQAEVVREDETGVRKNVLFDEYRLTLRNSISGVSYSYAEKGDYYSLEVYTTSSDGTIAIAYPVSDKEAGEDVAVSILKWASE